MDLQVLNLVARPLVGWAEAIFGQNEVLNTPQVPPTVVTARAGGSAVGYRSRLIDPGNRS